MVSRNILPTSSGVAAAADSYTLSMCDQCNLGLLFHVLILSDNTRHNCVSVGRLCNLNYTILFTKTPVHTYHPSDVSHDSREGWFICITC